MCLFPNIFFHSALHLPISIYKGYHIFFLSSILLDSSLGTMQTLYYMMGFVYPLVKKSSIMMTSGSGTSCVITSDLCF